MTRTAPRAERPAQRRRPLGRALAALGLAGAVSLLALTATGSLLIVETYGVSMLPRFRTGDLAVVMTHPSYHVGEIVAYRSPLLHVTVFHRIVAEHGGRFTFKGDNNDFLDPLRLPASSIRGSLLFQVPDPGGWLQWLESHGALAVTILMGTIAVGGVAASRRARRHARPRQRQRRVREERLAASSVAAAAAAPLVAAGLAAALLVAALAHATSDAVSRPVTYRQSVAFGYQAAVPASTLYPAGAVTTGMPVFTRLVQDLDLGANFRLAAHGAAGAAGSMALEVAFSADGWSQVLGRVGPVRFHGRSASLTYRLDLARAQSLLSAVASESGIPVSSGTIVVTPTVRWRARIGASTVTRTYGPPMVLELGGGELVPVGGSSSGALPHYAELSPSATGSVTSRRRVPATLRFFGHPVPVTTVRDDAALALLAALVAAAVAATASSLRLGDDEAGLIRSRYRRELVDIAGPPEQAAQPVIDVASIGALAQIADAAGSPLLHCSAEGRHEYFALRDGTCYRYQLGAGRRRAQDRRGAHVKGATRAAG